MLNSRINKFIFQEGRAFLRLKTKASELKVIKEGDDYSMDFLNLKNRGKVISVPVVWIENFVAPTLSEIELVDESWGQRYCIETKDKASMEYYLNPLNEKYGVKIGPISKSVEGAFIDIDWTNLQWGKK